MQTAPYSICLNGQVLTLRTPRVMGILNITPDSFYQQSRMGSVQQAVDAAGQMALEGATFIDIGGQSTRPGATLLPWQQEAERIVPVVAAIAKHIPQVFISVDTFYAPVAKAGVEAGAHLINDVSAGNMDWEMLTTVGRLQVPYVCMHMQGTPATMQQAPAYQHVVTDILDYFIAKLAACRQAGITDVLIDPGFGFGKTMAHNFQLLHGLEAFHVLECPLLIGLSRKAMVYKTLQITAPEALNGTTVLHTLALLKGAHILRVHDVKEAVQAIALLQACQQHQ